MIVILLALLQDMLPPNKRTFENLAAVLTDAKLGALISSEVRIHVPFYLGFMNQIVEVRIRLPFYLVFVIHKLWR